MTDIKQLEQRLKGKSYQELDKEMSALDTEVLLTLLNGKGRKIGSTASSLLNRRNAIESLAKSILAGKFTNRDGKVRAANTISFGRVGSPAADEALLFLCRDKTEELAGNALFALVALRRAGVIPKLEQMKSLPEISPRFKDKIALAIQALEQGNPRIYSPHYGG